MTIIQKCVLAATVGLFCCLAFTMAENEDNEQFCQTFSETKGCSDEDYEKQLVHGQLLEVQCGERPNTFGDEEAEKKYWPCWNATSSISEYPDNTDAFKYFTKCCTHREMNYSEANSEYYLDYYMLREHPESIDNATDRLFMKCFIASRSIMGLCGVRYYLQKSKRACPPHDIDLYIDRIELTDNKEELINCQKNISLNITCKFSDTAFYEKTEIFNEFLKCSKRNFSYNEAKDYIDQLHGKNETKSEEDQIVWDCYTTLYLDMEHCGMVSYYLYAQHKTIKDFLV